MPRITRSALFPALLLAIAAAPLASQTVRGTLLDPATGGGVRGATVLLLEPGGREASSAVTGPAGEFMLHAGHGGRFTLRADRIGYRATVTPAFDLSVGETVSRRLAAGAERVGLEMIAVTARSRCQVRPGAGNAAGTAQVWEEARKALQVARTTSRERVYRFALRRYRRALDPRTGAVKREETRPVSGWSGDPFVAAPPAVLADSGWARLEGDTSVYFAPDAAALLSDPFQDAHCFRLVDAPAEHPGWIGVAFEPVRQGRVPDVKGVMWVDRQTSELQTVDFRYTGLPGGRRAEDASSGTIQFRRLPGGSWIVTRWRIRMPQVAFTRIEPGGALGPDLTHASLRGLVEEGGEVTSVVMAGGQPVPLTGGATLVGVVFDSTRSAPLGGATVTLQGTSYRAVTDGAGRYELRDLPEGTYAAAFASPRLDTLGYGPEPRAVTLSSGASARADLAVPPLSRVLAAACADSAGAGGGAPLVGMVRPAGGEAPVQGAAVTAWWTAAGDTVTVRRTALADYRGVYRFCSVPAGVPVHVGAAGAGAGPAVVEVKLAAGVPAQQDLMVVRRAPEAPEASRVGVGSDLATVWGRVLAAGSGAPVAGATVRLGPDLPPATTDRTGRFRIDRVRPGAYDVVVTALTLGERRTQAEVPRGGLDLELRLPSRAAVGVALAPVVVTARTLSPVEVMRRTTGSRVEIMTRQDLASGVGAPNVQNVLRARIPAVKVFDVYYPSTSMVEYVRVVYHDRDVAVYLDDVRLDPRDFAYLSPDRIEAMEFFPEGYRAYGEGAMQPVLLMHSRK
jgi:hypothetical protein